MSPRDVGAELRVAVRTVLRERGFAALVVGTLALGIGATTAIVSVVDAVLLRATPFEAMDRLVMVWETDRDSGTTREPASFPDVLDFQAGSRLVAMAALMGVEPNATVADGSPLRLAGLAVTHDLVPLLGLRPLLGRTFEAADDRPGAPPVVLISEGLWGRLFGRDPDVVGRSLRLDGVAATIVGVLPDDADFGALQVLSAAAYARAFGAGGGTAAGVDVWMPRRWDRASSPRFTHPILIVGRLAPGATVASAQRELGRIAAELERTYPENDARGVFVEPLGDVVFGPVRPALWLLVAAVALTLVVTGANVAALWLARGVRRRRDAAVRRALGASRWHLTGQALAESLVLTLLAAGVGVAVAAFGLRALLELAPPDIPRLDGVRLDARVLGVTSVLTLLLGVTFAVVPAAHLRSADLRSAPAAGGPRSGTRRRGAGRALVVGQVALAVILMAGTGLLLRSLWNVLAVDPGFRTDGVLKAEYQLPAGRYPTDVRRFPHVPETQAVNRALLAGLSATRGVVSAAIAGNHPLDAGATNSFAVVGREAEAADWPEIAVRRVTPGYVRTVELPVVAGRPFLDTDAADAPAVALINQSAAARFFPDGTPLGHELAFWGARRRIVGVVGDERLHGPEQPAPLAVYLPLAQAPSLDGTYVLLARTRGEPARLAPAMRRILQDADPALAPFGIEALDLTLDRSVGQRRFIVTLLGLFATLAVVLAAAGVYGTLNHAVAERTREIGIRLAIGAHPARVAAQVLAEGIGVTLVGLVLGGLLAAGAAHLLRNAIFGIAPIDPVTFAVVPVVVMLAATLACAVPALRAARVDPLASLRVE